jgi:ferredoxin-NADP reductase
LKARLVEYVDLCPEVRHFVFEAPEIERLDFQAGQFVSLSEELEGRVVTRAYSIASPPDGNRFALCLNLVHDGKFSPYLFGMQPGDTVEMKGPMGYFVWRQQGVEAILVAVGTGIAPFRGMLLDRLAKDRETPVTLVFGARYEHGLLYLSEFNQLARDYSNFRFLPTITRPTATWTGLTGRIQAHLFDFVGERRNPEVYICGMKEMVDDVRKRLKEMGFDRRQIIFEKYD